MRILLYLSIPSNVLIKVIGKNIHTGTLTHCLRLIHSVSLRKQEKKIQYKILKPLFYIPENTIDEYIKKETV